jgi:hypothetical protein
MASSFISKDNIYGFWVNDSIFQVVCRFLFIVISKQKSKNEKEIWVDELLKLLDNNAKGFYHSYMHLDFDDILKSDIIKNKFKEFCILTQNELFEMGEFISNNDLILWYNREEIGYKWVSPLGTKRIIKVIDYLQDIINNDINYKVSDEVNYDF